MDARDESGWLPVHWAAQSGSVETLCNLHYLGADFVSRTLGVLELTIGLGLGPLCNNVYIYIYVYMMIYIYIYLVYMPGLTENQEFIGALCW